MNEYKTNEVIIRDATMDDLQQIVLLMDHLSYPVTVEDMRSRLEKIMIHPDYRTIVADVNGELAGLAGLMKGLYYEKNGDYLRILAFVTKREFRGRGIAKLLMNASEDWAKEQGLGAVLISSGNRDERMDAHAFYKRMGYAIKSSGFVKQL